MVEDMEGSGGLIGRGEWWMGMIWRGSVDGYGGGVVEI